MSIKLIKDDDLITENDEINEKCPKCNGEIDEHRKMLLKLESRIESSSQYYATLFRDIEILQKQINVRQQQLAQLYSGQANHVVNLQNEEARLHSEIHRLGRIKNELEKKS